MFRSLSWEEKVMKQQMLHCNMSEVYSLAGTMQA